MSVLKISGFVEGPLRVKQPEPVQGGKSFGDQLTQALGSVESLQNQADNESDKLAAGAGNLHETALALEKADVAMRVAIKVRNKLVDAYHEVMRMSV